jgi:hypothetical protein
MEGKIDELEANLMRRLVAEHDRLLRAWQQEPHHRGECFIHDGIIDPSRWPGQTERKVLFLLREAYDADASRPQGFDLCRLIRGVWQGPKWRTYWNIADWAFAAQQGTTTSFPTLMPENK